MAESVRMEPADMYESARQIDTAAGELKSKHESARGQMSDAHGGWVGASAQALAARIADWEKETASHHETLTGHANNYRSAAAKFLTTDRNVGQGIDDSGQQL